MNKTPFKKADAILSTTTHDLDFVLSKVKRLAELQQHLSTYIDAKIWKYCQVGNLAENRLTLIVANGSIATQLRFQTAELLQRFSKDKSLKHIRMIECKVRPVQSQPSRMANTPDKHMPMLSPTVAEIIKDAAESLDDPALKEIMERIAKRSKPA